jgi:hypothetical protein
MLAQKIGRRTRIKTKYIDIEEPSMRKSCPDEERLADYIEGRLSVDDRSEIEAHLSSCKMCLEEFMVAERLVRGGDKMELDPVPGRVTQAAVRLINSQRSKLGDSLSKNLKRSIREISSKLSGFISPMPWGAWSFAPIRGSRTVVSKDHIHLKKSFRGIDTEIEIEKTGENKAQIRVGFPGSHSQREDFRVTLKRGEREVASHLFGRQDRILFEDTPFGHYSLDIKKDGTRLGTYRFEIKESSDG